MHITPEQLEQMRTHEVADLLSNLVMALRRLPDVPWRELQQQPSTEPELVAVQPKVAEKKAPKGRKKGGPTTKIEQVVSFTSSDNGTLLTEAILKEKKLADLKKIATDLNITGRSTATKEQLIEKILERQARGHSEQFAIQNM